MKLLTLIRVFIFSAIMTLAIEGISRIARSQHESNLTKRLCAQAGNSIEVGGLRDVYEIFLQGLKHSGINDSCVVVTDNGRSYAPNCMNPQISYHTTFCQGEFNTGVKAQILYAEPSYLSWTLLFKLTLVFVFLIAFRFILGGLTTGIADKLRSEFERSLNLNVEVKKKSLIAQWIDWILLKTGVVNKIKSQKTEFENKIANYESKLRQETFLRVRKEIEIEKSNAFSEKVKLIRHDLKSPLTALHSLEDVLQHDDLAAKTLNSAVKKIRILIEDLHDVEVKKETARFSILEEIVQDSLFSFAAKIKGKVGIHFSFIFDHENLSPVMTVKDVFQRIVSNLLDNSLDAIGSSGKIQMKIQSHQGSYQLIVEDNGCGINPTILPNLFSKGATFGKINGLGLGLYSAKKALEDWGGKVEAVPLQQGTRFIVSLPKVQTGVQFVGPGHIQEAYAIDDDPSAIDAMKRVGIKIHSGAYTYTDGLELIRKSSASGLQTIVDYRLDNNKLGTDLIAEHGRRSLCVLCTSDFDNPDLIREAKHLGVRVMPKALLYMWVDLSPLAKASASRDAIDLERQGFGLQLK